MEQDFVPGQRAVYTPLRYRLGHVQRDMHVWLVLGEYGERPCMSLFGAKSHTKCIAASAAGPWHSPLYQVGETERIFFAVLKRATPAQSSDTAGSQPQLLLINDRANRARLSDLWETLSSRFHRLPVPRGIFRRNAAWYSTDGAPAVDLVGDICTTLNVPCFSTLSDKFPNWTTSLVSRTESVSPDRHA